MAKVSKTKTGYTVELDEQEAAAIDATWASAVVYTDDSYYSLMFSVGRELRALRPRDVEVTVTVSAAVVAVLMREHDARTVTQLGAGLAVIDLVGGEVRKAMRG